jgi:hypothetical protein
MDETLPDSKAITAPFAIWECLIHSGLTQLLEDKFDMGFDSLVSQGVGLTAPVPIVDVATEDRHKSVLAADITHFVVQ